LPRTRKQQARPFTPSQPMHSLMLSQLVALFGSYGDGRPIADPYYGGMSGFEKCYEQCVAYSQGLLKSIYGDDIYSNSGNTSTTSSTPSSQL
ncbi:hypothetical protein FRB99_007856, partial [Tulasnella sp. 403]